MCLHSGPVALLNNDRELRANAVINSFSRLNNSQVLGLYCVGTLGNGMLQWLTKDVERFPNVLDEDTASDNEDLAVFYYSNDRRDSLLLLQPIAQDTVGLYTCKSAQSGREASVLTTFQDPYFAFTNPNESQVPLGVKRNISASYAYASDGFMNVGSGFLYNLTFEPTNSEEISSGDLEGSGLMPTEIPSTSEPVVVDQILLDDGITDSFSNNYVYDVYAGEATAGRYTMTCEFISTYMINACI